LAVPAEQLERPEHRRRSPRPLRLVPSVPTDPDYTPEKIRGLLPAWRRLRSHFEHRGDIDEEAWGAVIDIERMVTALGNYRGRHDPALASSPDERRRLKAVGRDAAQAAEMIASHLLLGWTSEDSRFPSRAKRLERKVIAFGERYLAGAGFEEADRAFEEAR
jgi:hypothetical protein